MGLPVPFELERYFARHEFAARYLLSASDCESLRIDELLAYADGECRAWWDGLRLGYTESPGHPLLRAEVARSYAQALAGEVLIAAPEEAIYLAMSTLLAPGDHVVVLAPYYQSLGEVARANGCQVTAWNLRPDGGGWRLDLAALEASLTARTRMLVINFPHNPTGHLPSREELEAIVAIARRRQLYLFSDEMYRGLEYDATQRLPAVCDLYDKGITLSGLSKAFGLAGLRIGWLVTRAPHVLERCLALKDYLTICSSAPSEVLAVVALRAQAAIVARNVALVAENLAHADAFFAARPRSFTWQRPRAGSVAFPGWCGAFPIDELCRRALERGVMIVPGQFFDHAGANFRLGLGRRDFALALAEFAACCDV